MSFRTIYLTMEVDVAYETILRAVDEIHAKRVNGSIEYRDAGGMTLAVLSSEESTRGASAKLRYQTSVIIPHLAHGRPKARQIRDAVESHRLNQ